MKIISSLIILLTLAISPVMVHAVDPTPVTKEAAKAPHASPFRGTVSSVDTAAGTFTIANKDNTKVRVFKLASAVKLTKADKDITLAEVKAGDYVRGSGMKIDDTKFEVNSAKFGPKSAEEIAADKEKKEKKAARQAADKAGN